MTQLIYNYNLITTKNLLYFERIKNFLVFFLCIETRTFFFRKISVPVNLAVVFSHQSKKKCVQRFFLSWCPCVFSSSTTNVANTNRMQVLTFAMCTDFPIFTAFLYLSVKIYNIVIANLFPAFFLVPAVNVCRFVVSASWRV